MDIGMIGLGRTGASIDRGILAAGRRCVVHDRRSAAVQALQQHGAVATANLDELFAALESPRTVWSMLSAGAMDDLADALFACFASRGEADLAGRGPSATRLGFGGHRKRRAESVDCLRSADRPEADSGGRR